MVGLKSSIKVDSAPLLFLSIPPVIFHTAGNLLVLCAIVSHAESGLGSHPGITVGETFAGRQTAPHEAVADDVGDLACLPDIHHAPGVCDGF